MIKPITLFLPTYYDTKSIDQNRLIFTKTKPLLKEDRNKARLIASIEKVENYKCSIPEIGEAYSAIATRCFNRDREEGWDLPVKVGNCKVYTYRWNDEAFHFRIYWIVLSEQYILQLVNILEPKYAAFYKSHFMSYFQVTEIDTSTNFSIQHTPDEIFECKLVEVYLEDLQALIDSERQKAEKAKFLEENLKVSNPAFYDVLEMQIKEQGEALIENFICTDWNRYYDLHNPENFSDPDSTIEWENNADVFEYYEKPPYDNSKVSIACYEGLPDLNMLKKLVKNRAIAEEKILAFAEQYTFGNGGAYADAIHFQYAKIEMERLHDTLYTNQEFLKRNLYLETIIFSENTDELRLHFSCSWDTEHGIDILLDQNFDCSTVE